MADTKITALAAITTVDPAADVLPIVDVSDTSMAASGTTKKITSNQILGAGGTATLASATITGDLTARTTGLVVNSSGVGIGTSTMTYNLNVTGAAPTVTGIKLINSSGSSSNLCMFAASSSYGSFGVPSNAGWLAVEGANPLAIGPTGNGAIIFTSNGSEQMRLNSTGLGVGASPNYGFELTKTSPTIAATSNSTTGYSSLRLRNTATSGRDYEISLGGSGTGAVAAGNLYIYDNTAAAVRFLLDSSGNVGVGVTPSAWSGFKAIEFGSGNALMSSSSGYGQAYFLNNAYYNGSAYIYKNTQAAVMYQQNQGAHQWYNAPSGTAGNAISWTQAMTLDASGNLLVGVTSANANGGVLQLKSGITFPATQVASSDANTLDDYEEGTWTPTGSSAVNCTSVSVVAARYTKIGRIVTLSGNVTASVTVANTLTYVTLTGLPFNNAAVVSGSCFENNILAVGFSDVESNNAYLFFPATSELTTGSKSFFFEVTYHV